MTEKCPYPITEDQVVGLTDLINASSTAQSGEDLHWIVCRFIDLFCFASFFFSITFLWSGTQRRTLLLHNYPSEGYAVYRKRKYYLIDPVIHHCRERTTPFAWHDIDNLDGGDIRLSAPVSGMRGPGRSGGISFPIHGGHSEWGVFTLNTREGDPGARARVDSVAAPGKLFSVHLQEAARRILLRRATITEKCKLTRREKDCLRWMVEGKTAWEISRILDISERTVVYHLQNLMSKVGATNRVQAAARIIPQLATDPAALHGDATSQDLLLEVGGSLLKTEVGADQNVRAGGGSLARLSAFQAPKHTVVPSQLG